MYYLTVKQPPTYRQMTLEDLLNPNIDSFLINANTTNTRTFEFHYITERIKKRYNVPEYIDELIDRLAVFNSTYKDLKEKPRKSLYREFKIPKKSGGLRTIDAPEPRLMEALRTLKDIFEVDFKALYHTSAFAYIKKRCIVDCVKRHQNNESKWFGKYDLSNFFGSTTMEFTLSMLEKIFPFCEVMNNERGRAELESAIELGFLNGGLPQGTPLSPILTNIIMIPIDFTLSKKLRDFKKQKYIYTRYADDFQISSRYNFNFREIENLIIETLKEFNAPFQINTKKTRYGSSSGQNWNLGIMLNKDNNITVGHKNKKRFQAMLHSYIMDKKNGIKWDLSDVRSLDGIRNYYCMIEKDVIDRIIGYTNKKFDVNVLQMIRNDLKSIVV